MRVIKSDSSGIYFYQKIFKHVLANNLPIIIWQVLPSGERSMGETVLHSYHLDTGHLHFELRPGTELSPELLVYCYSQECFFIFKAEIQDIRLNAFSTVLPKEIKLLDEPDVQSLKGNSGVDLREAWKANPLNFSQEADHLKVKAMAQRSERDQEFLANEFKSVTLDEEDRLFADKRETPRARPKMDKWVKIIHETSDEVYRLKLFDLSQGGMSFITKGPHVFEKNTKVMVIGFDEFNLDDPLIAEIMSSRPVDETELEFKVGCKFDEGQG